MSRSCRSRARRNTWERHAPAWQTEPGSWRSQGLAAPGVIGIGDTINVLVGQLAVGAVHHTAELTCVDEEHLAAAVAELAVLLVTRQEPQAGGDLRRVEELAWQRHHAVHEVASTICLRISPSPDWFDDIEPLASTKPATPAGAR